MAPLTPPTGVNLMVNADGSYQRTQRDNLNTEPIPTMWHMRHWLSHHQITIHNDGTQLSFTARLSAEQDGYELDDSIFSELSAGSEANDD